MLNEISPPLTLADFPRSVHLTHSPPIIFLKVKLFQSNPLDQGSRTPGPQWPVGDLGNQAAQQEVTGRVVGEQAKLCLLFTAAPHGSHYHLSSFRT